MASSSCTEAHTALLTSTVTVTPWLTVTASELVGTDEPPHVVVLLQLPVTEAVLCAIAEVAAIRTSKEMKIMVNREKGLQFFIGFPFCSSTLFSSVSKFVNVLQSLYQNMMQMNSRSFFGIR